MPALLLLLTIAHASPLQAADPAQTYDRLHRAAPDLNPRALGAALATSRCAASEGELPAEGPPILAVIDYSRPSTEPRLWVFDLEAGTLLFREHVAHGQGSGEDRATRFSNQPNSHQTSLGLFRTAETYQGQHGYSLRLDGLEPGLNDRARARDIVIHGADYVSDDFIARVGRLGRSWGCPAVDEAVSARLIDTIKGGAPVYAWTADPDWISESALLQCGGLASREIGDE